MEGKDGVVLAYLLLHQKKAVLFVLNTGQDPLILYVESVEFFPSPLNFEVSIHDHPIHELRSQPLANILSRVAR